MPFNPFAGQPADTHRGRPRRKEPEPEPTPSEPQTADNAESSWEAAWGGAASTEPEPKADTEREKPPTSASEEQDSPDAFAVAFAQPDRSADTSAPEEGDSPDAFFAAAFGGREEATTPPDTPAPEPEEGDSPDAFAAAFARPDRSVDAPAPQERNSPDVPADEPEPDAPPEFAAAFSAAGEDDPSNEPEDLAERARLERIGMETADPDDSDGGFGDWRSMIGSMPEDGPADRSGGWGPEEKAVDAVPAPPEPVAPEPDPEPVEPSTGGWGRPVDGWPAPDDGPSTDGWDHGTDMEEDEEEPADAGGGLVKPIIVIVACTLVIAMLGVGAFLLVRNIADRKAGSAHNASCATYSRWVGEYNRAASDAKRLSVKTGTVDRQCPASGVDKAAKEVKAKAERLSAEVAKAAKREWTKDKKTMAGLKDTYPSASVDTLSDAKDLAGEDDPTDLADLNDMKARAKALVDKAKKEQSTADAKAKAEREAKEKADAEAKAKQEAEQEAARQQAEAEEAARQQAAQQQSQQQSQQSQRTYTPQRRTYTPQRQTTTPAPTPAPAQPAAPSGNASQDF